MHVCPLGSDPDGYLELGFHRKALVSCSYLAAYSISVTLGKSFNLCEYASSYINIMYLIELLESNALP